MSAGLLREGWREGEIIRKSPKVRVRKENKQERIKERELEKEIRKEGNRLCKDLITFCEGCVPRAKNIPRYNFVIICDKKKLEYRRVTS